MKLSEKGIRILIDLEGIKNSPYQDIAGLWTIGIGHLLTKNEMSAGKISFVGTDLDYHKLDFRNKSLTIEEIKLLLKHDLHKFEYTINNIRENIFYMSKEKIDLTQNQFDALVLFIFNIGVQAFNNSTLKKELEKFNLNAVPLQMKRWIYSGGKVIKGLINRREKEVLLWKGEI